MLKGKDVQKLIWHQLHLVWIWTIYIALEENNTLKMFFFVINSFFTLIIFYFSHFFWALPGFEYLDFWLLLLIINHFFFLSTNCYFVSDFLKVCRNNRPQNLAFTENDEKRKAKRRKAVLINCHHIKSYIYVCPTENTVCWKANWAQKRTQ